MTSFNQTKSLINLKEIDKETRLLVFGFINNAQKLLDKSSNNTLNIIPKLITYICLSYYWLGEYFAILGRDVDRSKDRKTITKLKENYKSTSYGNIIIETSKNNNNTYKWVIQGTEIHRYFVIGIASNHNEMNLDFCDNTTGDKEPFYSICPRIQQWKSHSSEWDSDDYPKPVNATTTMKMNLNLQTKKLILYHKDDFTIHSFSDILCGEGITYRLAICLYGKNSTVTISNFEIVDNNK